MMDLSRLIEKCDKHLSEERDCNGCEYAGQENCHDRLIEEFRECLMEHDESLSFLEFLWENASDVLIEYQYRFRELRKPSGSGEA